MANNEDVTIVRQFCNIVSSQLELEHIDTQHHMDPSTIKTLIKLEMERLRAKNTIGEDVFTALRLLRHPVHWKRITAAPASSSAKTKRNAAQQQADSFRQTRIKNKIKKTKFKLSRDYIADRLQNSTKQLLYMRGLIEHTEEQLKSSGYNAEAMLQLQKDFGLDRCVEHAPAIAPFMPKPIDLL